MKTFDAPTPVAATIDVVSAAVRVTASARATATVDGRPGDPSDAEDVRAAEGTRVELAAGRLVVKAPKLRSWLPHTAGGSIEVTVELPAGSSLNGAGQLAEFEAEGELGDCRIRTGLGRIRVERARTATLKTGSGEIAVDHVAGDAVLVAGSGDIRAGRIEGSATVKASNGDTWIGAAVGEVRLRAANGDVVVEHAEAGVSAKAARGALRVDDVVRGSVELETQAGDVEVGIREGTAAWLDLSVVAGRLHNELEVAGDAGGAAETVEVRARTSLGDVAVRRARTGS
jgi:DUF4097 and DUF4098 domain-containing protein YvlB